MHRTLMQLFAVQGRHDAALKQYELCKRELTDQLQTAPDRATLDLLDEIRAQRRVRAPDIEKIAAKVQQPGTESFNTAIGLSFSTPDFPSIAVMPFVALNTDPNQDVFAEGISDDITTALSKIDRLLVVAHRSTLTYKGKMTDTNRISSE